LAVIRILVVDDQTLVCSAFRDMLGKQKDFLVVSAVGTAQEALDWVRRDPPEVVLMDLRMPGMDGIEAARHLHAMNPAVKCICLTAADEPIFVRSFLEAGGRGYVTKACRPSEVFHAIRQVMAGEEYVEVALSRRMWIDQLRHPTSGSPFDQLSKREFAVIRIDLAGAEKNDAMVGLRLGITAKTVSTLRHRAYAKLGVASRCELFRLATRWGLLGPAGDLAPMPA
jgi:two-component system invasion response regulator UvrY